MREFWLVVVDLWYFVIGRNEEILIEVGRTYPDTTVAAVATEVPVLSSRFVTPPLLPTASKLLEAPVNRVGVTESTSPALHEPQIMYCNRPATSCFASPCRDFDTKVHTFHYGEAVTVSQFKGEYAYVLRGESMGWVHKDHLSPDKTEVWPSFVTGIRYGADHIETIKTRLLLDDAYAGGEVGMSLQVMEFIEVVFLAERRIVPWSETHHRLPGQIQQILRGVAGVHIGVVPISDSVMEWRLDGGAGHVAFVREVRPDNTLVCDTVGLFGDGVFGRYTWPADEWREWRPVFIELL